MVERVGEMRKGRRERIEKGTKRQFEEKEGLREPPLLEFLDLTLRCIHCFFKSSGYEVGAQASKFGFYNLIECIIFKMSWCETECKNSAIGEIECNEI